MRGCCDNSHASFLRPAGGDFIAQLMLRNLLS